MLRQTLMDISILVDNPRSWIVPYVEELVEILEREKHVVRRCDRYQDLEEGDCAFFLSCEHIVPPEYLGKHTHNLVVHPSALPHGKGWSPLAWQILEGKNRVPITLFEALEDVDAGPIYFQDLLEFEGHELNDEMKEKQGRKTIELVLAFVDAYPDVTGREQEGEESFYPRRRAKDSELDIDKTLREQFNLLRIVDNERYPAFFVREGRTYILRISKAD